jgi:hypothetical protein
MHASAIHGARMSNPARRRRTLIYAPSPCARMFSSYPKSIDFATPFVSPLIGALSLEDYSSCIGRRTRSSHSILARVFPQSLTNSPANSSRVQRARPSGGFEQAVATSRASSFPESLRSAPGRGSSLSAACRFPARSGAWSDRRSSRPPRRSS